MKEKIKNYFLSIIFYIVLFYVIFQFSYLKFLYHHNDAYLAIPFALSLWFILFFIIRFFKRKKESKFLRIIFYISLFVVIWYLFVFFLPHNFVYQTRPYIVVPDNYHPRVEEITNRFLVLVVSFYILILYSINFIKKKWLK